MEAHFIKFVGSNILKTICYILTILLSGLTFSQTKKADDLGFIHQQSIYQTDAPVYFS